jgi:hypothetical protein
MALYRLPFGALMTMVILGVVLQDLVMDHSFHLPKSTVVGYYKAMRTAQFPFNVALLGVICAGAGSLLINLRRCDPRDLITLVLSVVSLALFAAVLIPAQERVFQDDVDAAERDALLDTIRVYHYALGVIIVAQVLLQLSSHAVPGAQAPATGKKSK